VMKISPPAIRPLTSDRRRRPPIDLSGGRWPRLILLFALGLIGTANFLVYFIRLAGPAPLTPWESAIAMEAVRFMHRLPLYEPSHATHMYGPFLTLTTAGIFTLTGFSLIAARIVFSLCGIALGAFLATLICRGERATWWVIGFVLFLGINLRVNFIFVSAQPDCIAALLALIALCLWVRPTSRAVLRWVGLGLFLTAVMFKQTSAAFALILPVKVMLWERPLDWKKFLYSSVPTLAIALEIGLIYLAAPLLFHAMIAIPAGIQVYSGRALSGASLLVATFPMVYLGGVAFLAQRQAPREIDRWICSALAVFLPVGVWTLAKSGAGYNSLLYAFLAMVALTLSQLPSILRWIDSLPKSRSVFAATCLGLILIGSYFFECDRSARLLYLRHGDERMQAAIAVARAGAGRVISPEDPSIAYRGSGYIGRSAFFELDGHANAGEWPAHLPAEIDRELVMARGVIEVRSYVPLPQLRQSLQEKGFQIFNVPALEDSTYTLWLRP